MGLEYKISSTLEKFEMLAKTFSGLEEVLKQELNEIGASNVTPVRRGVRFAGDKKVLYKANFCCRTAIRILKIIDEFEVKNAQELYDNVRKIDWTAYFGVEKSFAVNSTVHSEAFNNSMFVSLKTKDAIVDQFREKVGKRPSVNAEEPDVRINVHTSAEKVTVSLDSSGESLHKRGYRVRQNEAPMSEVLAAGIIKLIGWKGETDLYDPMCGSGTLPIEAALIARNIPPGIFRQSFNFELWNDFDEDLFDEVFNDDYEKPFENKIYATDIASLNIKFSQENAKYAGVKKNIEFSQADFASLKPQTQKATLVVNPPYGERMREQSVRPLYSMIGDQLKQNFTGFNAWVFSSSEEGFKSIGLRYSERIKLYNGPLECSLRKYDVYEGSKKEKFRNDKKSFQKRGQNRSFRKNDDRSGNNERRSYRRPS